MPRGLPVVPAAGDQEEALMMTKTNAATPCAACRLLRRRCAQECPFSPYFSPSEPLKFAYVHKVFGASNVAKMLMEVPESQRADTATSLVYEATVRLRDPVYGCVGAISILQRQVQSLEAELNAARAEMLRSKLKEGRKIDPPPPPLHGCNLPSSRPFPMATPPPSQLPPLSAASSLFTHPSTSSVQYSNVSRENIAYFS